MAAKKTIYYTDPLTDDFARTHIHTKEVGADFPFVHRCFLWNFFAKALYYCVAVPIVFLISKLYLGLKYENRRVLRQLRSTGYFLYGNHTRMLDAFLPAMTAFPKKAYVISNPDAVSLPFLQTLVTMLGVIPIPTKFSGMRQFLASVQQRCQEHSVIAIFPEAHIWPFYTGIRPGRSRGGHGHYLSPSQRSGAAAAPPGHDHYALRTHLSRCFSLPPGSPAEAPEPSL